MAFQRDRLTWVAYGLLAWFAYLQAAPGLIVPHLRSELGLALLGTGLGNLFPLGLSVAVALVPDRAQPASSRATLATSSAVLVAPLTVGALADAASLTAALAVVPCALALAALALAVVRAHSTRSNPPASTASSRPVRQPRTASRTSGAGRSR